MNKHEGPDAEARRPRFQFSIRSLLTGISLIVVATINVAVFQHSQLLEYQYRRSLTEISPWIWPEGAAALFMLVWGFALIVCAIAAYRMRDKFFKCEALFTAAGALVAFVVNAWFGLMEAFKF